MSTANPTRASWILRLTTLELRKLITTRSTKILLLTMVAIGGVLGGGAQLIAILVAHSTTITFGISLGVLGLPVACGIPIIGVLVYTTDWQHRDMMTTLLLEPRRYRIYWAKLCATLVVGLAVVVGVVIVSLLLTLAICLFTAIGFEWGTGVAQLGIVILSSTFISTILGSAIGALTLNTPVGIVIIILETLVIDLALGFVPSEIGKWFSASSLLDFLSDQGDPGHAATAFCLWLLLPFTIGFIRNQRKEAR